MTVLKKAINEVHGLTDADKDFYLLGYYVTSSILSVDCIGIIVLSYITWMISTLTKCKNWRVLSLIILMLLTIMADALYQIFLIVDTK